MALATILCVSCYSLKQSVAFLQQSVTADWQAKTSNPVDALGIIALY
jgi:hypothetical protein